MRRRRTIAGGLAVLLLLAAAGPVTAQQSSAKAPRVGILTPAESDQTPIFEAFRQGLREVGYTVGRTIILEFRSARGDPAAFPKLAAELLALPVDIILTDGAIAARFASDATQKIPIVMGSSGADPVALGLAASMARPGGNLTGFTLKHSELSAKRLDLIRTAFPEATAVTVFLNPHPGSEANFRATAEMARAHGLTLHRVEAANPEALRALRPQAFSGRGITPLVVLPDAMFWNHRWEIVALVNAARVPALYPEREYVEVGGLIAYGPNVPDNFRRAAEYVDRILKGANPGDLPIQEPAKVDFVVNLKTARALGINIPLEFLARADEVIE
jgi:putative ABC transport system substrate-binding protein